MFMTCTVTKIQHTPAATKAAEPARLLQVAVYCRVSTDLACQQTSLEAQVEAFRCRISQHPGWALAGIYADEGLSATSTTKRIAFKRMMRDAEAGRIDYIITKSLSRFARNTLDCLTCIRHLQSLGVNVLFEKENIDTGAAMSEMLLTVLAAFAQEESRSISENIKWGLRKGFVHGQVRWQRIYGYRKGGTNGKSFEGAWCIEPTEAAVVGSIFYQYEHGSSLPTIVKTLAHTLTPTGKGKWTPRTVWNILTNEKYVGDVCAQKYVTLDHLSHKAVRNNAKNVPSYYIRNHHMPIVTRQTFDRVQKIRTMRNEQHGSIQYPYGEANLHCPHCGQPLVQRQMRTNGPKMLWCCFGEKGCRLYAVKTWQLNAAVLEAWQKHTNQPAPETVEFWWLDTYVGRIAPTLDNRVIVEWKDGASTVGAIPIKAWQHDPTRLLACYKHYIEDLEQGKRDGRFPRTAEDKKRAREIAAQDV